MPDQPFDIAVVASHRRPPIITEYLAKLGLHYFVSYTPDFEEPAVTSPHPIAAALWRPPGPGAYRCFRGHQLALGCGHRDKILVLEDDADNSGMHPWGGWSKAAVAMLDTGEFDVVSLHSRDAKGPPQRWVPPNSSFEFESFPEVEHNGARMVHQVGALAYMVRRATADLMRLVPWLDIPWDFVICNAPFRFCAIKHRPFVHDRRHGSLIDGTPAEAKR